MPKAAYSKNLNLARDFWDSMGKHNLAPGSVRPGKAGNDWENQANLGQSYRDISLPLTVTEALLCSQLLRKVSLLARPVSSHSPF